MTADAVYADPSALLKLYRREAGSKALAAWRSATTGALPITLHGELEIVNAICRYRHAGIFTPEMQQAAIETFQGDIELGRYRREDPGWRAVMRRSKELTLAHTAEIGTRTLDVLHVAAALELGLRHFLTFDDRQSALAVRVGLKLVVVPTR